MIVTIFDTETSGLVENHTVKMDKQPEVIDFYAAHVDLKKGKILKEFDTLIKPRTRISELITKITGITNELLEKEKPFNYYGGTIVPMLTVNPVVIGHNLSFDMEMIDLEMERLGRAIIWPRPICTVEQTIHLKGFRLSQTALHEHLFGEGFNDAHRAKPDTQALIRICIELFKRGMI